MATKHVLISHFSGIVVPLQVAFLDIAIGPDFVHFHPLGPHALNLLVQQLGATFSSGHHKPHNGVPVYSSHALGRPDRVALDQGGNDGCFIFYRKGVHG